MSILIAEDDPKHQTLLRDALRDAKVDERLIEVVRDGHGAVARLDDPTRALPKVIVLDLDLGGGVDNAGTTVLMTYRTIARRREQSAWIVGISGQDFGNRLEADFPMWFSKNSGEVPWQVRCAQSIAPLFDETCLAPRGDPLAPPRPHCPTERIFVYCPDESGDSADRFTWVGSQPSKPPRMLLPHGGIQRGVTHVMHRGGWMPLFEVNAKTIQTLLRYRVIASELKRPFGWEVLSAPLHDPFQRLKKLGERVNDLPATAPQYLNKIHNAENLRKLVARVTGRSVGTGDVAPVFPKASFNSKASMPFPLRVTASHGEPLVEITPDLRFDGVDGFLTRAHFVLTAAQWGHYRRWQFYYQSMLMGLRQI